MMAASLWTHALAVAALAVLCGLWVVLQRARVDGDPDAKAADGSCGGCHARDRCAETPNDR